MLCVCVHHSVADTAQVVSGEKQTKTLFCVCLLLYKWERKRQEAYSYRCDDTKSGHEYTHEEDVSSDAEPH